MAAMKIGLLNSPTGKNRFGLVLSRRKNSASSTRPPINGPRVSTSVRPVAVWLNPYSTPTTPSASSACPGMSAGPPGTGG